LQATNADGGGRIDVERAQFWAMVQAARTASREHLSRQLELAAARRCDLPPPQLVGYRRMELLAARLGDLPLSEVIGFSASWRSWKPNRSGSTYGAPPWSSTRMGPVDDFWCSEDSLWGFREWLVEQGQQVYQAAIADPDSLADDPELDDSLPWGKGIWGEA
jgi:hypothetical protein